MCISNLIPLSGTSQDTSCTSVSCCWSLLAIPLDNNTLWWVSISTMYFPDCAKATPLLWSQFCCLCCITSCFILRMFHSLTCPSSCLPPPVPDPLVSVSVYIVFVLPHVLVSLLHLPPNSVSSWPPAVCFCFLFLVVFIDLHFPSALLASYFVFCPRDSYLLYWIPWFLHIQLCFIKVRLLFPLPASHVLSAFWVLTLYNCNLQQPWGWHFVFWVRPRWYEGLTLHSYF